MAFFLSEIAMLFLTKKALSAQKMTVFATLSPTATSLFNPAEQFFNTKLRNERSNTA
jgi:hypothetical protein